MKNNELRERILYLKEIEKLSIRQIAEQIGISRNRCSRICSGKTGDRVPKESYLEPYRSLVGEWYAKTPSLKASQVFERLRTRGVVTSYTTVKRFTRKFRANRQRCYWPLAFEPGEEAQVDWFVVMHPMLGKLAGFALILSYSRFLYAHIFPRMSFEFFIEGHLGAFKALRGFPRALRYDNLRSVVTRRNPRAYNPNFLEFARYHGFEIRLCNVRAGNEKGRVERAIRTIRETFLNTAEHHQSLRALNGALAEWLDDKNSKPHRATGKPPAVLRQEERLKTLPQNLWLNRIVHARTRPTKTGLVAFDTNLYSVPEHLVGQDVEIHAFCDRLEIYDAAGKHVASHPRSFERKKTILNPCHRGFGRISAAAKTERIYVAIKNLDPVLEHFIALNEAEGENPFRTAHCIFRLLRTESRSVILSAVREAIARNIPRSDFILKLLTGSEQSSEQEQVSPMNKELLTLDYKPRALEDYLP